MNLQETIGAFLSFAALLWGCATDMVQAAPPALWQMQRVGEPTQEHPDVLRAPAISPDGKFVASANGNGVRLWDATTGEPLGKPMIKHHAGIHLTAWSPDGRYVASGGYDGLLVLWDAETHALLWEAPTHHEYVYAIAFSPNGERIATGGKKDGSIRLWERATGRELGVPLTGHTKEITALAFADDKTLLSTSMDGNIGVWNTEAHSALRMIPATLPYGPQHLARHPHQPLVAVSNNESIAFWNYQTSAPAAVTLKGYGAAHGMSGLAFTEDGQRLMSADSAGGVALIDWQKGEAVARGAAEQSDVIVWQTAFFPKGDLIATAGKDGVLGLWHASVLNSAPGFSVSEIRKQPHPYGGAVTFYSDNGRYMAHFGNKQMAVVDRNSQVAVISDTTTGYGYIAAFTPDNQWFAYAAARQQAMVVHLPTRQRIPVAHGQVMDLRSLAFSPDGSRIAVGFQENNRSSTDSVILAETRTGKLLSRYTFEQVPNRNQIVSSLAFSPDGKTLLLATQGDDVARLNAFTLQPLGKPWPGLGHMVVFSPDGRRVAAARHAGYGNTQAVIVDAASGEPVTGPMSPKSADATITSLAFTPDGRFLLNAAGDRVVMLWDAATGERLGRQVLQYEHAMRNIRLTADARRVYATSGEGRADSPFQLMEWDISIDPSRLNRAPPVPVNSARPVTPTSEIIARLDSFEPNAAAFVPGREETAVAVYGGTLRFLRGNALRETTGKEPPFPDYGHGSGPLYIHYVAVSRDGRRASAAWDGATMRVYDVETGRFVSMLANTGWGPDNYIANGHGPHTFMADGKLALTWEHGVRIFDVEKGIALIDQKYALTGQPTAIAAANRSSRVALGTNQGMLLLAPGDSKSLPISIERALYGEIVTIAYSPNDHIVATGAVDGSIRLFDALTGSAIARPWRAHARAVTAMSFSSDGDLLASGAGDGTLRVWSLRTSAPVTQALIGHTGPVLALQYGNTGDWLSFARDGSARRWHIVTERCPTTTAVEGTLIGDLVNLRAEPSAKAKVISTLPFGTRIRLTERGKDCATVAERTGHWVRVKASGDSTLREGWVFDSFVMYDSNEQAAEESGARVR